MLIIIIIFGINLLVIMGEGALNPRGSEHFSLKTLKCVNWFLREILCQ